MNHKFTITCFAIIIAATSAFSQLSGDWNPQGNNITGTDFLGTTNNFPLIFKTGGNEHMRLLTNGNLGLGFTTPVEKLDVNGNIKVAGNIFTQKIIVSDTSAFSILKSDKIMVSRILSTDSLIHFGPNSITINSNNNTITYTPVPPTFPGSPSFINGLGIGNGGTVGRGLNSTAIGLHVSTGVNAPGSMALGSGISQTQQLANGIPNSLMVGFNSNIPTLFVGPAAGAGTTGNVGINTTSPQEKLQVEGHGRFGSGNNYIRIGYNSANAILDNFGQGLLLINYYSGKDIHMGTGAVKANLEVGGNVGLGTGANTAYRLSVNGFIRAKEVVVETGWSDYVFEDGYTLMPLNEVEQYVRKHKHLPGVTKGSTIEANGLSIGAMQAKHMEKIEELTLYIIQLQKQIDELKESKR